MSVEENELDASEDFEEPLEDSEDALVIAEDWSPERYQSLLPTERPLKIFFYIFIAIALVVVVNSIRAIVWANTLGSTPPVAAREQAQAIGMLVLITAVLSTLANIGSGIVFLTWFKKLYTNNIAFQPEEPPFTKGWAIGMWFTPVVNLWRPLQMIKWVAEGSGVWTKAMISMVGWWWGFWIARMVMSGIITVFFSHPTTISDYIDQKYLTILAAVIDITALKLCINVVREFTTAQEQLLLDATAGLPQAPIGEAEVA